ncbi:hypothetical protein FRC06_010172 [Ceratobasidium sp. 370]|nr:hypothetical protein FRC06_010172 [Ceratobasidium sp. 370]
MSLWELEDGVFAKGIVSNAEFPLHSKTNTLLLFPLGAANNSRVDFGREFNEFTLDPSQDLVVLVGVGPEVKTHGWVCFRSSTTGQAHPQAAHPVLTVELGFVVPLNAPFGKKPLQLTLKGVTSDERDLSVDLIRTVTLPHLSLFGIDGGVELKIKKRGAVPLGGGEVEFLCPVVKQIKTLNFVDSGKIIRIRGIAHAVRVSSDKCPRMIDASRQVLNRYINDIYLVADVYRRDDSGKSPGFGMSLVATSTTGALHCAEAIGEGGAVPNDIGYAASRALLAEIKKGGCVDRHHQWLVLLLMVLGSEDVGRCRMGELTVRSVQFLRDIKQFFGTSFKITAAPNSEDELMLSCFGTGYVNSNKAVA